MSDQDDALLEHFLAIIKGSGREFGEPAAVTDTFFGSPLIPCPHVPTSQMIFVDSRYFNVRAAGPSDSEAIG